MPNNHISPTGYGPFVAHDRLVIDVTRKAAAWVKKEKQKNRNSANASAYPETTILALPNGGRRRIHTLPAAFHVPRRETADGIWVHGCAAHEAIAGTAPLRGAEKHKSNRPLALAPQQVLKWLDVPATSPGDTIPPNIADHTVAADAKSAPGCALPAPTTETVLSARLMGLTRHMRSVPPRELSLRRSTLKCRT